MRLYVDLETLQLIEGPGFRNPVTSIRAKRGDGASIKVQFLDRGLTPVQIGDPATLAIRFGCKPLGDYASHYLVLDDAWTLPEGAGTTYTCAPNLNTEELSDALGVAGPNELAAVTLMAEIEWSENGGLPTSTRTFPLVVENDVNRGTEGSPLAITQTPEEWLGSRVVNSLADAMGDFGISSLSPERPPGMVGMLTTKASGSFIPNFKSSTGRATFLWWDGATAVAGSGSAVTEYGSSKVCPTTGNWRNSSPKRVHVWPSDSNANQSGILTELRVESMNLWFIDVRQLPDLTSLKLSNNSLTRLDTRSNAGLLILNVSNNPLRQLDLGGNPALITLACGHAALELLDLSAVPLLTSLLIANASGITALDLSPVPSLASIDLQNCTGLTTLDLTVTPSLTDISVWGCSNIVSIAGLFGPGVKAGLNVLKLYGAGALTGPIDLIGKNSLTNLNISHSGISAINNLETISALSRIEVQGCPNLTDLNMSGKTNIELITMQSSAVQTLLLSGSVTIPAAVVLASGSALNSVRAQGIGTFSYMDFGSCQLSAAELNQFYADLSGGSGTINVVGNPGDGDPAHLPAVATSKGYSVINTPAP